MKAVIIILSVFIATHLFSQDTTELIKNYNGAKSFKLTSKKDTSYYIIYPDGKKESHRPIKNNQITGKYTRWYENGKLMWEKDVVNGIQEGRSIFYNEKGGKVAVLNYKNGILVDTVYVKENTRIIFGKITFSSKVYGGMQREDGSSNISEHSGSYMNCYMYAAKIDSLQKTELIQNFKTDINGDFFVVVPEGKIAFFPKNIDIKTLQPGQYDFAQKVNYSGNESWSMKGPTIVTKDDIILFITLHHSSVGYAP